jgi:hypothetical protein
MQDANPPSCSLKTGRASFLVTLEHKRQLNMIINRNKESCYYNSRPVAPFTQVGHVRMCQAAFSSRANAYIPRKHTHTHCIHTPHTHAHKHEHTVKRTQTRAHTHTRTHNARQDKGSDTLAEVRRYVFKHNGSAIDTRAQARHSVYRL